MRTVNIHKAKTTLSALVMAVERGETVVIARNGVPVVRMEPVGPVIERRPGAWRTEPGWENYEFDPKVVAPMTDAELEEEGWPV